ncbi:glycosyltransferase [Deltaproteobacteria bacterium]|nr:glycosyltransferase [Deltaproteobacteria bacterium]
MQKIKVLHILHSFGIGGMEKGIAMLINHASDDFEHMILCLTCTGDSKHLISPTIPIYEMYKSEGNSFGFIGTLARKIRQINPDIVHTRNWGGMDGIIAARLAGCKAVVHGEHGWGMDDPQGSSPKRKFLRRWLSLGVTEFTAVSKQIKVWLEDDVRVFKPVTQIYNGVVFNSPASGFDKYWLYRELSLPESALLIGTVGRLDPIKDQAGLIEAFMSLRESLPDAQLLIVGHGPEQENLQRKAAEGVHLLGMRNDVAEILKVIDIFTLPSLNEGIANTVLEAMAAGLPIVATAVGGTPELLKHGYNGLLVEPKNCSDLTQALAQYLENPDLRLVHGNRNRQIIEDSFSIQEMVSSYESVWQRVAGETYQ